jgi:hypothetical protein
MKQTFQFLWQLALYLVAAGQLMLRASPDVFVVLLIDINASFAETLACTIFTLLN